MFEAKYTIELHDAESGELLMRDDECDTYEVALCWEAFPRIRKGEVLLTVIENPAGYVPEAYRWEMSDLAGV